MSTAKKKVNVQKMNNRVMIGEVWSNSLLERLSGQLSTRTVSFVPRGELSKKACPDHYAYDLMIPLAHAERIEPLGWIIFGAKYMNDELALKMLRSHVAEAFGGQGDSDEFADVVINNFCYGAVISGRRLRRALDLTRGTEIVVRNAMQRILSNLHAVEENYAREVRKLL